ncbi:MAG: acetyltransferase [Natronospirillum sp.]
MSRLNHAAILGAGGHGKVIAEIIEDLGFATVDLFDNEWPDLNRKGSWFVVGKESEFFERLDNFECLAIAYTNNQRRLSIINQLLAMSVEPMPIVHRKAMISKRSKIGFGTQVCIGAIVQTDVELGHGVIINTAASIDHDCQIADGVQVGPGARLAGGVSIGNCATIGAGAILLPNISVGHSAVVGAGSVVLHDVPPETTVVGRPARSIQ